MSIPHFGLAAALKLTGCSSPRVALRNEVQDFNTFYNQQNADDPVDSIGLSQVQRGATGGRVQKKQRRAIEKDAYFINNRRQRAAAGF